MEKPIKWNVKENNGIQIKVRIKNSDLLRSPMENLLSYLIHLEEIHLD